MAYFIAEHPLHCVIRPEKQLYAAYDGRHIGVEPEITVTFRRFVAPEWARAVAAESYEFKGQPAIEGMRPQDHVAWLDTEEEAEARGWSEEELELAHERLRGVYSQHGVIEVFRPLPREPWPNYLELPVSRNLELAGITGFPLSDMLEYEVAARNDAKAVQALTEAIAAAEELETIVAA